MLQDKALVGDPRMGALPPPRAASPAWHGTALPRHAEPGTRDGHRCPSQTAIGQALAGAVPPPPAHHHGRGLTNMAGHKMTGCRTQSVEHFI